MKNLNTTIRTLLVAMLFMTIYSCDKTDLPAEDRKETTITATQMANSNNAFDEEGKKHNDFLDFFQSKISDPTKLNKDLIFALVTDYYKENKLEFSATTKRKFEQSFEEFKIAGIGGPHYDFNLCKRFPALCSFLPGPYNPIELLQVSNGGTSTDRVIKYLEAVKKQENNLIANKEVAEDTKTALLIYSSVARHSAAYWHNELQVKKSASQWTNWTDSAVNATKPCHTCDVVGADAAGAGVGFIFGGPVGAGIVGGIASAATIIEKIWF